MTIQARLNEQARRIFKKLYQNQEIDLKQSQKTLDAQLDLYLSHLANHLKRPISKKDQDRIYKIVTRNNQVAAILDSPEFKEMTNAKKELLGDVALGLVFCIDGRIPAIFLGGRFASHWMVPAGELKVTKRASDSLFIPESSELSESLRNMVIDQKEVLEICFAHTSLLNPEHGCGAMAVKRKNGLVSPSETLEEANLKIIKETSIPAITNITNEFRLHHGFDMLKQICISAVYDTDTFGVILNFDQKGNSLSTTTLTNEYRDTFDEHFIKFNIVYGAFHERFTDLRYLKSFSKNVLVITRALLNLKKFEGLNKKILGYIEKNYPDLTNNQAKALLFFIMRTIAFQYLSGSSTVTKKHLDHPFSHHLEKYMAISTRGTTIGKFDPENQGFSSTPADEASAVKNIKTKLSIMSAQKKKEPYILFICNPVNIDDLQTSTVFLHKTLDANAELFRAILHDGDLIKMIKTGEIIPVSVLIKQDSREVLKIVDNSAYV